MARTAEEQGGGCDGVPSLLVEAVPAVFADADDREPGRGLRVGLEGGCYGAAP